MKICFLPIDNRPVCYCLAENICKIDDDIKLYLPPRELLGGLSDYADRDGLLKWLEKIPEVDCMILSLDTLIYGGLISSRRISDSFDSLKQRVDRLKHIIDGEKVYAFSSIMRISNNNYNEEEKAYWDKYGKKIFEYSYFTHKNGFAPQTDIPDEIIEDYKQTRRRNFEINKMYLGMNFEKLIFSKDDCAQYGFNVMEAEELEKMGAKTKTGADEIPLSLMSGSIKKDIKIFPMFLEPDWKNEISNYEDISIEKSVLGQLELGGYKVVSKEQDADIVLVINNFVKKQGELVMNWDTEPFKKEFIPPKKPYAIADVRFANGGDNNFVKQVIDTLDIKNFYGYSGWNTSANSLGSLLACVKVKYQAKSYNDIEFKKLQAIRLLDDWAYQANVRAQIDKPCPIDESMLSFQKAVEKALDIKITPKYSYPWNRKFEIEITL